MAPDPPSKEKVPHLRKEARPSSLSEPLPRSKLPSDLQKIVDYEDSEDFFDSLYEGSTVDSTDTNYRYAAYAARARTILLSAQRYVAYTSDIGESFRPIAHPYLVRGAYAVSWAYLIGDVSVEGYKAHCRNERRLHPDPTQDVIGDAVKPEKDSEEGKRGVPSALGDGVRADSGASVAAATATVRNLTIPAIEDYKAVMVKRAVFQSIASMGLPAFTIHSIVKYAGKAMKNVKNTTVRTWGPIGVS